MGVFALKAQDRVLKTLLELDNHHGEFFNLKSSLELAHPDLSQEDITEILGRLKKMSLISTPAHKLKGPMNFVKVNPAAYIYYQNREERDAAEAAAKAEADAKAMAEIEDWEDRSWNMKVLLVGYAAGLVSGIVLMWIRAVFFLD